MTKAIQIKTMTLGSGLPKICVPLTGTTRESLYEETKKIKEAGPDLVEWRADYYEDLTSLAELKETISGISGILEGIPLLFTIRTRAEGGLAGLSVEDYGKVNLAAAETGLVDLIDVEVFGEEEKKCELIRAVQSKGVRVIASSHDFQKTDPQDVLLERFDAMDKSGADILKMAVMPKSFADVAALLLVTAQMTEERTEKPVITMSMGSVGALSRVCGEMSGSALTFGTVGAASAPGQIPVDKLKALMRSLHEM
jgi:3-dehydroquinate dehydratase-1